MVRLIKLKMLSNKFFDILFRDGVEVSVRKTIDYIRNKYRQIYVAAYLDPVLDAKSIFEERISKIKNKNKSKRKLYIVIPSYNDVTVLKNCINSIRKNAKGEYEKIVISDDASPDFKHKNYLRLLSEDEDVVIIYNTENRGFSANVNSGIKVVPPNADILLLNSDTEILPNSICAMQNCAINNNALVGARLLYSNGLIQHGGGFRNFNNLDWFDHSYRMMDAYYPAAIEEYDVLFCTGAALYISSEVRLTLGAFDEEYKMGFEDVDYCLRAWDNNIRVMYCGLSEVIHHESITRGLKQGQREIDSKKYFWSKNQSFFSGRKLATTNNDRKEIHFVLKDTGVGGGHRVIFNYCNFLASNKYLVKVWSLAEKPKWFDFTDGIDFLRYDSFDDLEKSLSNFNGLKIATWWETAPVVWRASVKRGMPLWLVQDIESSYYKGRDYINELKAISSYRPEFVYIVNYKWIKKYFAENLRYHANFVGLGVDKNSFYRTATPKTKKSVLVCARGEKIKGFDYSKKIIEMMYQMGFSVTAYGIDESLVADLSFVRFVNNPTNNELRELYNESEFFLQTSIHEGLSLPPLEAMNCHCIPVVTDAFGNRDYILPGENCIILDRILDLDIKKLKMINYELMIQDMLPKMLETVKSYDWTLCFERLIMLIENISNDPQYGRTNYQ